MVRNYKKKSSRKATSPRKLAAAVELVRDGWSIRTAAQQKGINRQTLWRVVHRTKSLQNIEDKSNCFQLSFGRKSIFSKHLEDEIVAYCIDMARMGFGLSTIKVRELAFETAVMNNLPIPQNWEDNKMAGIDWFKGFKKRHTNISIRVPEGCSIARASAFNKKNIDNFFNKLEEVLKRNCSFMDGSRLYNMDETSTSTVQNTRKIVCPKGIKQVHQVKSAERGTSVTTCCFIGAHGVIIPPVMIFPRKYFKSSMTVNAFPGTLGLANDKGYMSKEIFVDVLKHFVKCSGSSKENPTLLLIDNVETHLSANAINFARQNGVTLFTFPPHCTHKLQPLDVGIFSPFKLYYDNAVNSWMMSNPGVPVTIYHVAGFVREALSRAATPLNIIASFEKPGIFPFNRLVFQDSDYIMSTVTEQQDLNEKANDPNEPETMTNESCDSSVELQQAETSKISTVATLAPSISDVIVTAGPTTSTNGLSFISPVNFKGYPKVQPKQKNRKPRRKGKCMIATDTPEKNMIEDREKQQMEKKQKAKERKRQRKIVKGKSQKLQAKKEKYKKKRLKKVLDFDKTSNDLSPEIDLSCKEDDIEETDMSCEEDNVEMVTKCFPTRSPDEGDYVLVVFGDKEEKYFVGKILKQEDSDGDLEISYLKKTNYNNKRFVQPSIPDIHSVNISEIKVILPKPTYPDYLTKRQKTFLTFEYDFSNIHLG